MVYHRLDASEPFIDKEILMQEGKEKDGKEIERRFVVRAIDPDFRRAQATRLVQGYFDTSPHESLRVRILDDTHAVITQKHGTGLSRDERELPIPLDVARMLLSVCGGNVLRKTRYVRDGWEIDEFDAPLSGLILAEYEMYSEDEDVQLPSWISDAVEVTHSLTNAHLARLANDLGSDTPNEPVRDLLPQRVPRIVLTGGPCSGKSEAIRHIREEFGDLIHCVPEVATIVISQVNIVPPMDNHLALRRFQRTIAQVQRSFEDVSNEQALRDGKKVMLLDRGIMDSAAYMIGGVDELERVLRTRRKDEYARYDHVIYLDVPPEDVYDANKANNPARREDYAEAAALGKRIHDAWFDPWFDQKGWRIKRSFTQIGNFPSWEEKWQAIRDQVDLILRQH